MSPILPPFLKQKIISTALLFDDEFNVDWLVELTGFKAHEILSELQEEVEKKTLVSPKMGIYYIKSKQKRTAGSELRDGDEVEMHRRIVNLLMRDLPEEDSKWIRLNHHLMKITNNLEGCRLLSHAGDVHRKCFRTEQAFQCYSKILEDLRSLYGKDSDLLFAETAVKYAKISTVRQDTAQVLATLKEALTRAQKWNNIAHQALLEMHIAKNEWLRTNFDQAMTHFENGWTLAKNLDDPHFIDSVTAFGTFFLFWQGRFHEAIESYERSVNEIEKHPQSRFPILGKMTVGYCYAQTGNYTQGLGMLDALRTLCLERGDLYLASYAITLIGEIMLDMRQLDDALHDLEQSAEMAAKTDNRGAVMLSHMFLAFAYYLKGNNSHAIELLNVFYKHQKESGATVLPYPHLLALAWEIKQGRFPQVKDLSLQEEIAYMVSSKNIYMQGLGYRFQALMMEQAGAEPSRIIEAYKDSIRLLEESGHKVALSRSCLALSRYLLKNGDRERAREMEVRSAAMLSALDEKIVPDDLQCLIDREKGSERLLKEIMELGKEFVKIRDRRDLVQKIISAGNRVTGAERGAIFMLEEGKAGKKRLHLKASINLTADEVERPDFSSSLKMIENVSVTGHGAIAGQAGDDENAYISASIRSKISVPLTISKNVAGVLYYDNLILSSTFKETDLGILSYFSALAAIAIDNASAYDEINRLNKKLTQEKQYLEEETLNQLKFDDIVGTSKEIGQVLTKIEQVAGTETTVLITGETGVGKELVARAIHRHSSRKDKPFIGVQLSALPAELMSTELMGHEKGSFTGAMQRKIGRFELANGGTLFLDEIADISLDLQVQLLRVLQTRQFERVGGTQTLQSDFRLITATNCDLMKKMQEGRFRADLYYRLNVFPIHVPPLNERKDDIPLLAYHFLKLHATRLNKNVSSISENEMHKLVLYNWPGNVRELQNIIERGVILSSNHHFYMPKLKSDNRVSTDMEEDVTLAENERRHIVRILKKTGEKVAGPLGAAAILGVPPSTLVFRMKKLGIQRSRR
jgi:formate hydrogenlyase transcriptional activator